MDLWQAIADGMRSADEADGRQYGVMDGVVTDVNDPQRLGRVRVRLRGQAAHEQTDWMLPLWPGAIESLPAKNDPTIVMFLGGDPNRGLFATYARSTTRGRPTEAMVLGHMFARMFNQLVAVVSELYDDHNDHAHNVIGVQAGAATITSTIPDRQVTTTMPGNIKAADGSTPAGITGDQVALSGVAKVR